MIKKGFQTGIVASLVAAANVAWGSNVELRGVNVSATPAGTQVVLDLSATTSEKLFTLDHPERAVLDLGHTHFSRSIRLPPGAGVVSGFRIGAQPGGTLRFVMQLRSVAPTRIAWIQQPGVRGRQLVITLGDAPLQSAAVGSAALPVSAPGASAGSTRAMASEAVDPTPKIVRAAHAPVDSGRDVIVAVDAGHGGQDPGAIGHGGTREKDVTLAIARKLAERINGEPGMRAILTRDRDEFLVLRDRIGRARLAKADMFISIHADSIANRDVSGASVYVLSEHGATSEAARWLADRENAADLMGGVKLDDKDKQLASVLLDLSQSANISASMTAAQRVLGSLDAVGQVRKSQVQQAGFVVLKSPDIPSMLVETAYISNPQEELNLRNIRRQAALAEAIFDGLHTYFTNYPPVGTRFAQSRRSTVASVLAAPAAAASAAAVGRTP
ncbi:MAG TPA: N-acetylmuramoyl-L-alanine amidase [Steroidobacteraceae bacterium]